MVLTERSKVIMTNEVSTEKIDVAAPDAMNALDGIYKNYIEKWYPRYDEFAQGRTDFQIEKFISCEDVTPANTYHTVLYQTRVMREELMREIRDGIKLHREFEYRWKGVDHNGPIECRTKEGGVELHWYDLDDNELRVRLSSIALSTKDRLQQLSLFDRILDKLIERNGKEFEYQQLRDEEPEYWKVRFMRQMMEDVVMAKTGINGGNYRSVRMGMMPAIVDGSKNVIDDFPNVFNALASGDPQAINMALADMSGYVQKALDKVNPNAAIADKSQDLQKLGITSE